jgi:glycosyltransferase involved in cell wall biosynthesis
MPAAKTAIDATSVPPNPAGAGRYIVSLVRALGRVDPGGDYVVYARHHALGHFQGLPAGFEVVDVGNLSRWRRQAWEQTALPLDLRRRGVRLLHSPHHTTPLFAPCPRVVTFHDVTFFLIPERYPLTRRVYFQVMTILASRRARRVIVPSAAVREDVRVVLRLPPERTAVTYEGVEPEFRRLDREKCSALMRERYGLPEGYLLSLGTREPGKNREAVFRALRLLLDEGRDLHLAVVGQRGWRLAREEDALHELGLEQRVHFTGYVDQADLPALYSGASAFVFPSLYEGFGLPALEAMACGVPVVTSNTSALPEVVGDAALKVDPTDTRAIADAIARILDDETLAGLLREAGVERAAEFTWEGCATATVSVYRRLLGESD